ncbi:MAG: hypothetical protein AB9891_07630 [Anaerolineaceae bacterium]
MLADKLGIKVQAGATSTVFAALAAENAAFAGMSYQTLSETAEQWPIIGRQDVYYGGTGYDNHQGLGCTLSPVGEDVKRPPLSRQTFLFNPKDGLLTLIPFKRLFDRGTMMVDTVLLEQRKAGPVLTLHPKTAGAMKLVDQSAVAVEIHGVSYSLTVALDKNAPEGVGLAPASVGLPLTGPLPVRLRSAEPIINPDER